MSVVYCKTLFVNSKVTTSWEIIFRLMVVLNKASIVFSEIKMDVCWHLPDDNHSLEVTAQPASLVILRQCAFYVNVLITINIKNRVGLDYSTIPYIYSMK